MASTYSSLKIELIGTGEQAGLWGTTTNTNLGTALEEAIVGSADVTFSSADVTLTLTDTNASQSARHVRLNLTGTSGGARNLILGSGCQIDKPYLINNGLADTVTVKNTTGTGIAVPAGKTMWVYNNGTNVVDAVTHLSSLTLGTALPIASGGTGSTSTTFVNLATNVTGTLPIANGGTGTTSTTFVNLTTNVTGTLPVSNGGTGITAFGTGVATALGQNVSGSGSIALTTSPVFTTPNLGTPSAVTLTSATGLPLSTGVTGQLPLANGGTGANLVDPNADRILFWDDSAGAMTFLTAGTGLSISGTTLTATGSGGTVTSVSGTGTVNGITLTGTVTSSGSLTLGGTLSNVSLTTQVTGTLPAGNGGTGITSLGSGIATWLGTPSSANLRSAVTDETGTGSLVFATSPTLVTPVLGTPTSGTLSNCTVDGTDAVGFRNTPVNSRSAAYTLVLADAGKTILHPIADDNARTFTIPANSSVVYPIGTVITFVNLINTVTIAITSDTMYLAGPGTTGSRTLAAYGVATAVKVASTTWVISGNGLT